MVDSKEVKGSQDDDGMAPGIIAEHLNNLPFQYFGDVEDVNYDPDYNELRNVELNEATYVNGFVQFLKKNTPASPNFEADELERAGLTLPLAIFYIFSYLVALIYFTYSAALDESNRSFLSVEYMDNTDITCLQLPLTVTGSFNIDKSGYWSTEIGFLGNESVYTLTFSGSEINNDEYLDVMSKFSDELKGLGEKASKRDMAWNLVALSSWEVRDDESNMQFFTSTDATIVYDQTIYTAAILTKELGLCPDLRIYGDTTQANVNIHFPVNYTEEVYLNFNDSMVEKPPLPLPCANYISNSMIPKYTQWSIRDSWASMSFDIRSVVSAQAVNMGIIDIDYLQITQTSFPGLITLPPGAFYVDPFYSGMQPIYCLDKTVEGKGPGSSICFYIDGGYSAGQVIYYPWSVSLNYNDETGLNACTCPDHAYNEACNSMDVVFTLHYDRNPNDTQAALNTIQLGKTIADILYNDQENGDIIITELIHPLASAAAAAYYKPSINGSAIVMSRFDPLCASPTCGIVVFESSVYSFFQAVNSQNLQLVSFTDLTYTVEPNLNNGYTTTAHHSMCTDYVYLEDSLKAVVETVPQPLIYSYYECNAQFYYAIKNNIGSAAGTAGLGTLSSSSSSLSSLSSLSACAIILPILTYFVAFLYNQIFHKRLKQKRLFFATEKGNIQSLLGKRSKHALNNVVEGIVDELLILRNEVVDYRVILSKILASVKDIPGAEYQQIVELLKGHIVPDDALQQELIAFKRYFIYEQKSAIIGAEKTRMTGRQVVYRESLKDVIDKASNLQQQMQDGKRKILKKKVPKDSSSLSNISDQTNETQWSINNDPLSTVTLGMLSWDTFASKDMKEKETITSKFSDNNV